MRAREFIQHREVSEVAPFLAALGGALARGTAMAGGALARGAASGVGALARGAASGVGALARGAASGVGALVRGTTGNITSSGTSTSSAEPAKATPPPTVPGNTKIEPTVSKDPNKLKVKIGDVEFDLDLKNPQVQQQLKQLQNVSPK